MILKTLFCILFCCAFVPVFSQSCVTLGQNPSTAFPVCGSTVFEQANVPLCSTSDLFVPGCDDNASYSNRNPFYYKFTCYQSGTLSFLITPKTLDEDYDWQLYDITGLSPDAILTNRNIIVTGNWSGAYGTTGASASGVGYIQCASSPGDNKPTFAKSPNLILGHEYILLISHFTDTQSGYSLSFAGGTAVITDPKLPLMASAEAPCDGTEVKIKLNKDMKCSSLAANGSDFSLNTNIVSIIGASTTTCTNGFNLNELTLKLSAPLPPGTYKISAKLGVDNNTLLDNCDRQLPIGDEVSFTLYPVVPTPMDSISPVKCSPQTLELVFRKNIRCASIAANGSDFNISGPEAITVSGAAAQTCTNGLTKKIILTLNKPMQVGGTFLISLKQGGDGNTLLDECGKETPPTTIPLALSDTVNADFTFNTKYGCAENVVQYLHDGRNKINSWNWNFDSSSIKSTLQNPIISYKNFRVKNVVCVVSNGVCSDTSSQNIFFDNELEASFDVNSVLCPQNPAVFTNKSTGRINEWFWDFGNGETSRQKDPAAKVYSVGLAGDIFVNPRLIVKNDYGCYDTASKAIRIISSCYVTVPSAFTPNGDGLNDYLYPLGAYRATKLNFKVYDRFGNLVFYSQSISKRWDGRFKGNPAAAGNYVWVLTYTDSATGESKSTRGNSILIR